MLGKASPDKYSSSPYLHPLPQPSKTPPANTVSQQNEVNNTTTLASGSSPKEADVPVDSPLALIDTLDEPQDQPTSEAQSWAEHFRSSIAGLMSPLSTSSSSSPNLQDTSSSQLPFSFIELQDALAPSITDDDPENKTTAPTPADSFLARLPQPETAVTATNSAYPTPPAYLSFTLKSPPSLEQITTNLSLIYASQPASISTTSASPPVEALSSYLNYIRELFALLITSFKRQITNQLFNTNNNLLKEKSRASGIDIKETQNQTTYELDYWKWSLITLGYYDEQTPIIKNAQSQYWLSFFNEYTATVYISAAKNFLASIYNPTDHTFNVILLRIFLSLNKLFLSNEDNPNSHLIYVRHLNIQRFLEHIVGEAILEAHQEKYPFNSVLELINIAQNENELELSFLANYQYPQGRGIDVLKNPLYLILFIEPQTRDSLLKAENITSKWLNRHTKELQSIYTKMENELAMKLNILTQAPTSTNFNLANEVVELQDYFYLIGQGGNELLNQRIRLYKLLYRVIHNLYENFKDTEHPSHEALYQLLLLSVLASFLSFSKKLTLCQGLPEAQKKEVLEQPSEHLTFILKHALKLVTKKAFNKPAANDQALHLTHLQIATLKICQEALKQPELANDQELLTHQDHIEITLQKLPIQNEKSLLSPNNSTTTSRAIPSPIPVINFAELTPDEQEKHERYILVYFFHPLVLTKTTNTSLLQTLEKDFLKYSPIWGNWQEFLAYKLNANFIENYVTNTKLNLDIFLGAFNTPHFKTTLAQKIAKKFIEEIFQKKLSTNLDAKQILELLLTLTSKICSYHNREAFKHACTQNLQCLGVIIKTEALATASMNLPHLPISLPKMLPLIYGPWPTGEELDNFLNSYICTFTTNEQTKKLTAKEALDLNPHFHHFTQLFFNTTPIENNQISSSSLLTPNDSGKITAVQIWHPMFTRIAKSYLLENEKNFVAKYYQRVMLNQNIRDPRKHSPFDKESLNFIKNILQREEEIKFLSYEFEQLALAANSLELRSEMYNVYFNIFYNFLEFIFLQIKEKIELDKHLKLYDQFYKYSAICIINSYIVLNDLPESNLKAEASETLLEYQKSNIRSISESSHLLAELHLRIIQYLAKDLDEIFTSNYAKIVDTDNFFCAIGPIIDHIELLNIHHKETSTAKAKRILENSRIEHICKIRLETLKIKREYLPILIAAHKKKLEQHQRENIPESQRKKEYEICLQNLQELINEQRQERLQTEKELQELLAKRKPKAIKAAKASVLSVNPAPQKTSAIPLTLLKEKKSTKTPIDMHIENMQKSFCLTSQTTALRIASENLINMLSANKMNTRAKVELYLHDANSIISYLIVFIKGNLIAKSQSFQNKVRKILDYNPYDQHDFQNHIAELKSLISYANNHFKEDAVNTLQALHLSLYLLNEMKNIISNIDSYALKSLKEQQDKNPHLNIDDIIASNKEIQTGCLLRESVIEPLQSLVEEYKQPLNKFQEIFQSIINKFTEIKEFKQKIREIAEQARQKAKERLENQRRSLKNIEEGSPNFSANKPANDQITLQQRIEHLDEQIAQINQATLEISNLPDLKTVKDELIKINEYTTSLAEAISDFTDPTKEITSKTLEMYMNFEKALGKN